MSDFMKTRNEQHASFKEMMPEVAENFDNLMDIVFREGSLSVKTKELIALGISVAVRCEPCMNYHVEKALAQNTTREEILEAMSVGFEMGLGQLVPPMRKIIHEKLK